jgi:predicted kinase
MLVWDDQEMAWRCIPPLRADEGCGQTVTKDDICLPVPLGLSARYEGTEGTRIFGWLMRITESEYPAPGVIPEHSKGTVGAVRVVAVHQRPSIFVIAGPMAAGKTTVARLLASLFPRGVHLEGDIFRRSILSGREDMTPSPSPEALAQLRLRYEVAAAAADRFLQAGFTVALEDVVAGPMLEEYVALIQSEPCHVVVLNPSADTLRAREANRYEIGYSQWSVEQFQDEFVTTTPDFGIWIDSTNQTPEETVDEILAKTLRRHS